MAKKTLLDDIIESIKGIDGRLIKQSGTTKQMIADLNYKVVAPARAAADSAVSAADAAVASAEVTSAAASAIASATAEAKAGANEAMSRALSAWDVATGAKSAVTDFDPLLKSAQSDAKQANETAVSAYEQSRSAYDAVQADSSAVVTMQSSMADFREDVASAQSVADSAKADASKALTQIADTANALSDTKTAFNSDVAEAKQLASTAQTTADSAIKSAASVASDLTAVASQAKSNASGITKVTSDVGLLQTTVADNSGNISKIQETAAQIQQAVSDNAGNITTAKQTADSAVTVASDAKSNATVAIQTASQASITASSASGQAASAVLTANGAQTTASDAKSDATVAVQTASGASLTATNAQSDATIAKQTASEATVQASNAESDFAQLSIRANKIEANVANNSGAIASVQQTANGLTTTVANIKSNGGGVNLLTGTSGDLQTYSGSGWGSGNLSSTIPSLVSGQTYTAKLWIQGYDVPTRFVTRAYNGSGALVAYAYGNTIGANSSGYSTVTWTADSNWASNVVATLSFTSSQSATHSGQYKELMLEEGAVAHTWSPAPDDLQNQFTQIKTSINGVTTIINDPKAGMTATYQTASQASLTAQNASGQAVTAVTTAQGAVTTAKNAQSDAVVAKQTASEASVTASNAAGDASVAKQTASQASISVQNAQSDITSLDARADSLEAFQKDASGNINKIVSRADGVDQTLTSQKGDITSLQSRADKLESSMSTANGQISTVQQTASGLTTSVSSISNQLKASGHKVKVQSSTFNTSGNYSDAGVWLDGTRVGSIGGGISFTMGTLNLDWSGYTQKDYATTSSLVSDLLALQDKIVVIYMADAIPSYGSDLVNALAKMGGDSKLATTTSFSYVRSPFIFIGMSLDANGNQVLQEGEGYLNAGIVGDGQVKYAWGYEGDSNKILTSSTIGKVTEIKTTVDGINTTINDPKTGLNATYQTAAGNASTISDVKGDVTQLQTTANGLTSRVGSLESKTATQQTAIDQNKTAITLKADQTTVNTLKGTVDQNTSTLQTQAGQIQSKVSASDVTGMLNGYATQSYTQSLVTQTAKNWNLNLTNLQTDVNAIKTTGGGVNLVQNTSATATAFDSSAIMPNANRVVRIGTWPPGSIKANTTYTMHIKLNFGNVTGSSPTFRYQLYDGLSYTNPDFYESSPQSIPTGVTQSVTYAFTFNMTTPASKNYGLNIRFDNLTGGTVSYQELMVEEGTVAHTWAPAPSDLATVTGVANLSATVDGIKGTVGKKADQSTVTQLSNLFQVKLQGNVIAQAPNVTLTYTGMNNECPEVADLQNPQQATNGTKIYLSFDYTADGDCKLLPQLNDSPWIPWGDNDSSPIEAQKGVTGHYFKAITVSDDSWKNIKATKLAIRSDNFNGKVTINNLLLTTGDNVQSTFDMLKDAINLRVTKGDLISQINLQTGASLIQSEKLVLDANTTVITGNAFIPSAAIANLTADQIQAGTLSGSKVHAGDNSGNAIDMGVLSDNYVGLKAYANNGDHTDIDLNGIHNYGASYDTRIQQGKITTNYLAVNGGGMIDFRTGGAGISMDKQEIKFYNSGNVNGGISFAGSVPIAESNTGGGNELRVRYDGSFALTPISDESTRIVASTIAMGFGYQQAGRSSSDAENLTGLWVNNSDRYVRVGSWKPDSTWSRAEFSSDGVNINYAGLSLGLNSNVINMYMDGNHSATAMQLKVDGWAWINGYCEAMGHTQHSTLSTKTRIEEADPDHMLDLVNNTELTTFAFKSEVAEGVEVRHIGPIIDDINDVAQYRTPAEFVAPTKTARDDDNMIGALFGAVQALTKRIKKLEDKLNE